MRYFPDALFALLLQSRHLHKERARFLVARFAGERGINDSVADVGVSKPILHEAQIGAGIEQVDGNGMLEDVEMSFVCRQVGLRAIIAAHQPIEGKAGNGVAVAIGEEQGINIIRAVLLGLALPLP